MNLFLMAINISRPPFHVCPLPATVGDPMPAQAVTLRKGETQSRNLLSKRMTAAPEEGQPSGFRILQDTLYHRKKVFQVIRRTTTHESETRRMGVLLHVTERNNATWSVFARCNAFCGVASPCRLFFFVPTTQISVAGIFHAGFARVFSKDC